MALNNILAPRQQVQTAAGVPIKGGQVFLREPGSSSVFISSFRDSGLVVPHTNPIRLSGSGRANIWISRDCDLRIEDKQGNLILEELNANPDALGVSAQGGLIPNGSFEIDADVDLIPDGWTLVSEAGSTNEIDATESTDGVQSFRFTSTGVGGGSLTVTDFFPVNDSQDLAVNFDLRSTVAAVRNIVRIEWYDVTQVFISNSDVYDSTDNPTVFTSQNLLATPPALARFAKFRLIGIDPSVALAGSTFFDRCAVFYPAVVSGVFDNITIQNNEIITTNTNGDLNLRPDGTGQVVIDFNGNPVASSAADAWRIRTDIVTPTPPTVEAVTGELQIVDQNDDDFLMRLGYTGSNVLRLKNLMHGGNVELTAEDGAGTDRFLVTGNPDGSVRLYHPNAGVVRLQTAAGSLEVASDTDTDAEQRLLVFTHQDATARAQLGHPGGSLLDLRNLIHGGLVHLSAENAAGNLRNLITMNPDGVVNLRDPVGDVARLQIQASGAVGLRSDGDTDAEIRLLLFEHQDGTNRAFLGHNGGDILDLVNQISGGNVRWRGTNAGAAIRNLIEGDPDGSVDIYNPNSNEQVADTQSAAAGGFRVNNLSTGFGFQRVLTISDRSANREILPADLVIANDVVLTDIAEFTVSAFSARGHYFYRCVLFVTTGLTGLTPGLQVRPNLTGVGLLSIGTVSEYDAAGIINTNMAPDTTVTGIALDSTFTKKIVIEGGFVSNDAAQVFSIQVAQNLTSANDTTIEAGSTFTLWHEEG